MRRAFLIAIAIFVQVALTASSAYASSCDDPAAQGAFTATIAQSPVAVGREAAVAVVGPDGDSTRSGNDWSRDPRTPATVALDDPSSATTKPGAEEVDALIVPSRPGTMGATVSWTQTSSTLKDSNDEYLVCRVSKHVSFDAVGGKQPPVTILGSPTGNYERNTVNAGVTLKGCSRDWWTFAIVPVAWKLHWTTNGSPPTRGSRTITWGSPDPCLGGFISSVFTRPKLTGPRRVANRTFIANRAAAIGYFTITLVPPLASRGMRGWWEAFVGGRLVKSVRFKWVYGSGYRRTPDGRRYPITGVHLEHDNGPCPGLRCTSWVPIPSRPPGF